jgi:hypothetical protein
MHGLVSTQEGRKQKIRHSLRFDEQPFRRIDAQDLGQSSESGSSSGGKSPFADNKRER